MQNNISKPTLEEVKAIDLSHLYHLAHDNEDNRRLLRGEAGVEHYKLLAWFSRQFDGIKITEVGTLGGLGTIALSDNSKNKVTSFDIRSYKWANETPQNAEKKIVYDGYMKEVLESDIIFYDAEHEGKEEVEFVKELILNKWKGILVLDDIHLNEPMQDFWFWCQTDFPELTVEDWTDVGHHSGTGVIFFD